MKRVVITGTGAICAIGTDVSSFYQALLAARSGITMHEFPWGSSLVARVAADIDAPFPKMRRIAYDRVTQLALLATGQALAQSGLERLGTPLHASGIYWGTGMGGAQTLEQTYRDLYVEHAGRVRPMTIVAAMNNAPAAQIAIELGIQGPSHTYSSACSSSAVAIGEAYRAICFGFVPMAIVGGAEALLTEGVVKAWQSLHTLATPDPARPETSSRPFAADRSGFVLGEGAATLILEDHDAARARGATILAEIIGYANTTDARHIAQPDITGQAAAMSQAIAAAGLEPAHMQYVNAHGTGTKVGDLVETRAIRAVFGPSAQALAISATKALHGHLMGATGALEMVALVETLRNRVVPPTAHLAHADIECDLDYVAEGSRAMPGLDVAMTNSFGFGGNNVSLIARRYPHR